MRQIALKKNERVIIAAILNQYVPYHAVYAFGSRVTGHEKPFSDLDLFILSDEPLPVLTLYSLSTALDESMLPFKVDLLDSTAVSPTFRKQIEKEWVLFQPS